MNAQALARSPFSLFLNECLPETPVAAAKPAATLEIHSLVGCPTVAHGTRYKLVQVIGTQRNTVAIGRAQSRYASLNLAAIRRRGARLGVQEVHLIR
jgi:hypothetical protein